MNYQFEDFPFCEWGDDGPESEDEIGRDEVLHPYADPVHEAYEILKQTIEETSSSESMQ